MEEPHVHDGELPDSRSLPLKHVPDKGMKRSKTGETFSRMAPAEHLDEARKALSDGYKPDANPTKTVWGRVGDARRHLKEIQPESSHYVAAQDLMHKTFLREKHIEHLCVNLANQVMLKQREMMANELEQYYVSRGLFVDIELSGPDKTFMKLMCSLFRETSIERIVDQTNFFAHLRKAGFKRVILSDNDENVWTYKLPQS
jgi:hypothetical protein